MPLGDPFGRLELRMDFREAGFDRWFDEFRFHVRSRPLRDFSRRMHAPVGAAVRLFRQSCGPIGRS